MLLLLLFLLPVDTFGEYPMRGLVWDLLDQGCRKEERRKKIKVETGKKVEKEVTKKGLNLDM